MNPEFLKGLKLVEAAELDRIVPIVEHRLYYNEDGCVTGLYSTDHPEGNYIIVESPTVLDNCNTLLLRVIDEQLQTVSTKQKSYLLRRSNIGQPVVKGMAALALEHNEEYQNIEYYDRQTNN